MFLSKRWKPLWRKVPKLVFDEGQNLDYGKFSRLVYRYLIMHEASVLQTLRFKLGKNCGKGDIQVWICAAKRFSVEELIIEIDRSSCPSEAILPRSLYTDCSMLVDLRLNNLILEDVSSPVSFPTLKLLELDSVKYPSDEFVKVFLSNCPALQYLEVNHDHRNGQPRPNWTEPSSIHECLLSSLETLKWGKYEGTKEEKELVAFLLRNGSCLKKVTISSKTTDPVKKLEMIKELSLSFRRSPTCALVFN